MGSSEHSTGYQVKVRVSANLDFFIWKLLGKNQLQGSFRSLAEFSFRAGRWRSLFPCGLLTRSYSQLLEVDHVLWLLALFVLKASNSVLNPSHASHLSDLSFYLISPAFSSDTSLCLCLLCLRAQMITWAHSDNPG